MLDHVGQRGGGEQPFAQAEDSGDSTVDGQRASSQAPRAVLSRQYGLGSVMLWVAHFMGPVIFYALINWTPILFKDAGVDARSATLIAALFPLGGCGAVAFGWLMDRFNANKIIAAGYVVTSASIWLIGQAAGSVGSLVLVVFLGGAVMNTAQSSLPAPAAAFYPTEGRATGVSWMLGFGRFSGIAGSFLVAELSRRQFTFTEIFTAVAVPGLVAAVALLVKQWANRTGDDAGALERRAASVHGFRVSGTPRRAGTGACPSDCS
jgi:AAHS family 4-hydroxybenzoate transporter-like MFS transporter